MDKNAIIERLYRDHKDHVYNYLARMANDPDLAMDVTQQTFIKALTDKNITQINNPKAYLFTIARNTLFNEFKRKKATSLDTIEEAGEFEAMDERIEIQDESALDDLQSKIEHSIKRMPEKVRELMILRYTEDLSIKEISDVTGRTLSDVKVNLHRARIKFESLFTNEMYAKVAVSRDQCDTLTTLLAAHTNTEIPEVHLQLVDKHIRSCTICSADAEQLKRSRVLFNLGALISAPYILDKMMSEAMASEFNFLSGTGLASTDKIVTSASVKTVGGTGFSAVNSVIKMVVVTKLISLKVAAIIGFVVVLVAGIFILTNLNEQEDLIVKIDPVNTVVPNTKNATSTTTTKGKLTTTKPKMSSAVKIDPDATALVNLKAKNAQTGNYIIQGMRWSIYSRSDSRGKPVSAKPELVQSSNSANFNVILESGYYLAKATYQGQTAETYFTVTNDTEMNVELRFGSTGEPSNTQAGKNTSVDLPTLHIRRKETGTYESNPLKRVWDICKLGIETKKEFRDKFPNLWEKQLQSIKESNPDFNLDRGIAAQPKWSSLTENYEDEYFSGEKYALYKKGSTYQVSENGSCELIKTDYETADIDDGQFYYDINFVTKMALKSPSAVVEEREVQKMYKDFGKNNPLMSQAMGKMLGETFLGKSGSSQEQKSLNALNQLTELSKVSGSETVAGEHCEYTKMGDKMGVRICYWKTMHEYPSTIKREIILKTTMDLSNGIKNSFFGSKINIAILFEKNIVFSNKIFSVPSDITITK